MFSISMVYIGLLKLPFYLKIFSKCLLTYYQIAFSTSFPLSGGFTWLHPLEMCVAWHTIKEEVLVITVTSSHILAYNHATYGSNFSFTRKNAKNAIILVILGKGLTVNITIVGKTK